MHGDREERGLKNCGGGFAAKPFLNATELRPKSFPSPLKGSAKRSSTRFLLRFLPTAEVRAPAEHTISSNEVFIFYFFTNGTVEIEYEEDVLLKSNELYTINMYSFCSDYLFL